MGGEYLKIHLLWDVSLFICMSRDMMSFLVAFTASNTLYPYYPLSRYVLLQQA